MMSMGSSMSSERHYRFESHETEMQWRERYERQQRLIYPERYPHPFDLASWSPDGRCTCGRMYFDPIHNPPNGPTEKP